MWYSVLSWCDGSLDQQPGARCSSVVRAFDHGAMGRRIDPSWWTHCAVSCSSQCSMIGIPKGMICGILCDMVNIKEHLMLIGKSCGALAEMRNSPIGPYCGIDLTTHCNMSGPPPQSYISLLQ